MSQSTDLTPSNNNNNNSVDVERGDDATLPCRFSPTLSKRASTLYWIRTNRGGHDNVAIGGTPFQENYSVDHRPEEGIYDLTIKSAFYDRDNGRFECRVSRVWTCPSAQ